MNLGQAALLCVLVLCSATLLFAVPATAAPDRLDDKVPDATPDEPGAFAASLGYEWLNLEGALVSQKTNHNLFKVRYQFNPKVSGSIAYRKHGLAGAEGLLSPLFNQRDNASVWSFDVGMNLLNTERIPADGSTAFTPGSAFTIGVGADFYDTSAGAVSESTTLLKAYLMYSTDLTEELRAHTFFSSGRLSGGGRSGSVNTIGAGLDYELMGGENPLTLLASGAMDIYNFRDPTFNTSRVSRFDLGLRYKAAPGMYTSLGWMTVNDSENDASGSGVFAGINWVKEKEKCIVCDPVLEEQSASQQSANARDSNPRFMSTATQQPPMMDNTPALDYPGESLTAGLRGTEAYITANSEQNDPRSNPGQRETPPLALYGGNEDSLPATSTPTRAAASTASDSPNQNGELLEPASAPVLLTPGKNTPIEPIKAETLQKIDTARYQVDSKRVDSFSFNTEAPQQVAAETVIDSGEGSPSAEAAENISLSALAADHDPAATDSEALEAEAEVSADEPQFEPATPQTNPAQLKIGELTEREPAPVGSNKYTRSNRFEFPAASPSSAEPAQASPEASDVKPANVHELESAALITLDDSLDSGLDGSLEAAEADHLLEQTAEEAAPAKTEPASAEHSSSSLSPVNLPLIGAAESESDVPFAAGAEDNLGSVPLMLADSAPETSKTEITTPSAAADAHTAGNAPANEAPRHIRNGERMQRPPVSETAKRGLQQLISLKLEDSNTNG